MAESQSGIPTITKQDLADAAGASAKLNNIFQFFASRIAGLEGASGATNLKSAVNAKSFTASDTSVPTTDGQVLTKGAADSLYDPKGAAHGKTVVIVIPGGFTVGDLTFHRLSFENGSLIDYSV